MRTEQRRAEGGSTAAFHLPGLTGLRGLAVAAVVAYHLGHLRGGFIGVDLFFVLSGFLITSLLLRHTPSTPAEMVRWWGRRIRRLTPAVAVTVLAVALLFATQTGIALDGLATLTWWQNWRLVAEGTSYWDSAASPLRHAWSLSIEEQFYLLWPPLLAGLLLLARRARARGTSVVGGVALIGAAASFTWAAVLSSGADADLWRIYFATDSRVGTLLLGCALAAAVHRRGPAASLPRGAGWAAAAGAASLLALTVLVSPSDAVTYRGPLLLAALGSVAVVAAASGGHPATRWLSWAPLEWLGRRSYAIYLWSWPTQRWLEEHGPSSSAALAAITVAVSLVLSDLSLRLVEEPLRHGSGWASALRPRRVAWLGGTAVLVAALVLAANLARPSVEEQLAEEFERQPDPTSACQPGDGGPDWGEDTSAYDPATVEEGEDPSAACEGAVRVLVVGDSTGRGAVNGVRRAAPADLEVWDRTVLGCGLGAPDEDCPDWRAHWAEAVTEIRPDVVLVYLGMAVDLVEGDEPAPMTEAGGRLRRETISEAIELLSSEDARVVWTLPAVPFGNGIFYCGGQAEDSPCDPDWVQRWSEDVRTVAQEQDASTVDVAGWVEARADRSADRPDGLHLSGPALDDHAEWLAGQLRAVAGAPEPG